MKIAICTSAHGFGHTARQLALASLLSRRHEVTIFTAVPNLVDDPYVREVRVRWDVGLVQRDGFGVDPAATKRWLERHVDSSFVDAIAKALRGFDFCVVDINPMVLAACQQMALPHVAIGNFSWSWIYGHFPELSGWARQFAEWESRSEAIDISADLGPGLSGFKTVEGAGLLARETSAHSLPKNSILLSFGGFGLENPEPLMPEMNGLHYLAGTETATHPRLHAYPKVRYPSLIAGAGVIVTKVGYGIVTEAMQHGVPLVCLSRTAFPEAAFLEDAVRRRGDTVIRSDVGSDEFPGEYAEALALALERNPLPHRPMSGAIDICLVLDL